MGRRGTETWTASVSILVGTNLHGCCLCLRSAPPPCKCVPSNTNVCLLLAAHSEKTKLLDALGSAGSLEGVRGGWNTKGDAGRDERVVLALETAELCDPPGDAVAESAGEHRSRSMGLTACGGGERGTAAQAGEGGRDPAGESVSWLLSVGPPRLLVMLASPNSREPNDEALVPALDPKVPLKTRGGDPMAACGGGACPKPPREAAEDEDEVPTPPKAGRDPEDAGAPGGWNWKVVPPLGLAAAAASG